MKKNLVDSIINPKRKEVKKLKKGLFLVMSLVMLLAFGTQAQAVIIFDNWTLDLSQVDASLPTVQNISEITFTGVVHEQNFDNNTTPPFPGPSVGDIGLIDGHLASTGILDTAHQIILTSGLNTSYEMTFGFSVAGTNTAVSGVDINFTHLAAGTLLPDGSSTNGILNIYIDKVSDIVGGTTVQASKITGDGYEDGTLIATFQVRAGDGGVFTPTTFDGSDDATFELLSALPGVLLDNLGNDLGLLVAGGELVTMAITDSNFDADPAHSPNVGFGLAAPTHWGDYFTYTGAGTANTFFAYEDGSAQIGVPEPSTILLIGTGILGLGLFRRKKT